MTYDLDLDLRDVSAPSTVAQEICFRCWRPRYPEGELLTLHLRRFGGIRVDVTLQAYLCWTHYRRLLAGRYGRAWELVTSDSGSPVAPRGYPAPRRESGETQSPRTDDQLRGDWDAYWGGRVG